MPSVSRAAVGLGHRYGNDTIGYITAQDLYSKPGFSLTRKSTARGLRPGPRYTPDTTIIKLGKAFLSGQPLVSLSKQLGISRKTAYRWLKRLGLSQQYNPSMWLDTTITKRIWAAKSIEEINNLVKLAPDSLTVQNTAIRRAKTLQLETQLAPTLCKCGCGTYFIPDKYRPSQEFVDRSHVCRFMRSRQKPRKEAYFVTTA